MRLSRTSSAIFSTIAALFTWIGNLADDDRLALAAHSSRIATLPRMMIEPRPVS